ncbi:hypothetical protein [Chryseobacterium sp. SIMBA_029]|uniref:hypothetical protein n=1 Tax=Chryseobacterium sp. SIMBA_029 TaxID=3085772 RepID=UPI00397C728C
MKKFISLTIMAVLLFSVVSCREVEELTSVPETNNKIVERQKKDSFSVTTSSTDNPDPVVVVEEKDPPPKDKIEW